MYQDTSDEVDNQIDDEDGPFLRDRVYYAAKDGLPLALYSLLDNAKDNDMKNVIINQVSSIKRQTTKKLYMGLGVSTNFSATLHFNVSVNYIRHCFPFLTPVRIVVDGARCLYIQEYFVDLHHAFVQIYFYSHIIVLTLFTTQTNEKKIGK